MGQRNSQMLFTLLRSAICGTKLNSTEIEQFKNEQIPELIAISKKHDVAHLVILALKSNALIPKDNASVDERLLLRAAYRYEQLNHVYKNLCSAFEDAHIPYIPLKGSILRKYYPEPWLRTSCDIDILVHKENLNQAISYLIQNHQYVEKERTTHDVSLFSPQGIPVELHFDLVEEGRANNAINVLKSVWDNVSLHDSCAYMYDMTDEFFYFYHIAHMAKHFENGGCGIRSFIDLWILDHIDGINRIKRDDLLKECGLFQFAEVSRKLSNIWFGGEAMDDLSMQMQTFILHGGVYGSSDNRVALQQKKKGGRVGYFLSRIFISHTKLKRYYPILEKYPCLMPIMQVRRWFMLLKPDVAKMARREILFNGNIDKVKADEMNVFLENIGL